MFKRILVPLDGSELAETALEPAGTIAQDQGGELILTSVSAHKHVIAPGAAGYGPVILDGEFELDLDKSEAYLNSIRQTIEHSGVTIQTRVVAGDVAGKIVDLAAEEKVDLIVMTTHGYSGITRWMLGSITERVLRGAPCPVLVIRCVGQLKNVLIALDGSRLAEKALEPGLDLARIYGGRVTLLQVSKESGLDSIELGLMDMASTGLSQQVSQDTNEGVAQYLNSIANRHRSPDLMIDTAVVSGSPARGILDFLEFNPVDLLVMATHGQTGLRRWVYGSVTEKCLRNSACAMLIVRPPTDALN